MYIHIHTYAYSCYIDILYFYIVLLNVYYYSLRICRIIYRALRARLPGYAYNL